MGSSRILSQQRPMRDTRMVAEEDRRLGREEGMSLDHRVRVAVMKGKQ